ncbi:MAG: ArsR/SmtB family transcription factor [Candidatus Thorarchaeota archaeon]
MELEESDKEKQLISLDTLLEILGNPTRRMILSKLAKVPHSAPELATSLGITRQAVHSQLNSLIDYNIIEDIDPDEKRGGKYRIKSNISVRIDISPDYYDIRYHTSKSLNDTETKGLRDLNCSVDYSKIKKPEEKLIFLGDQIRNIEKETVNLESKRKELVNQKECLILELKDIMNKQYKQKLEELLKEGDVSDKSLRTSLNLSQEIFFTMFFHPERYFDRINIDELLDDLFFANMDRFERPQKFTSVKQLLEELSHIMGFLREDEDDWFFNF